VPIGRALPGLQATEGASGNPDGRAAIDPAAHARRTWRLSAAGAQHVRKLVYEKPASSTASQPAGFMSDTLTSAPPRVMHDRLKAVLLMCAAVTLFSCLDTTAKYLAATSGLHTAQVVWLRFVGQALLMAAILGPAAMPGLLRTKKLGLQTARSFMMLACTLCNFIAIQYLRLDQTVSIAFLAPLVVAALAGPVLGEWVGWRRMLAILIGFAGILIVVRPGFHEVHWAFGISFLSMLAYAVFMLLTRKLSVFDPPLVTLFYALLAGSVLAAPFAIAHWVWPQTIVQWLMLLSMGAFGGLGHFLLIHAYRLAPASSVSPFLYFQLLSMVALGYLAFGDVPDQWTLLGSAVVIASGIYLVHRERVTSSTPQLAAR
jgi:drug/metabolite transporter (DMT)-like permease